MAVDLDPLDVRLLKLLVTRPRAGMREYARVLGVARGTVQARLGRLERRGAVRDYAPDVAPAAIGFPVQVFVHLHVAQGHLDTVTAALSRLPEVTEAYTITGEGDFLCRIATRDTEHFERVIQRVLDIPGIARTRSEVVLSERIHRRVAPLLDTLDAGDQAPDHSRDNIA